MRLPTVHPFLISLMQDNKVQPFVTPAWSLQTWNHLVDEATRHGLIPLLYTWLQESSSGPSPPAPVVERVKARAVRIAARNLLLAHDLVTLLRTFADQGVPCIPLRGPALAEQLYGDIARRPMGDLDLLIRKEDLPRVAKALSARGFQALEHRPGFAAAFSYTFVFLKDGPGEVPGGVIVEPHWTIAYPPFADRIDMEGVWKRGRPGKTLGVETDLLGREDLLLHLCLHLVHHGPRAPLLWCAELDRLIRQDRAMLDWPQFVRATRQAGQERFVAEVLRGLTELLATPVPQSVLVDLAAARTEPQRQSASERIVQSLGDSSALAREELGLLFTLPGLRARWHYARGLLFPSADFMILQYGPSGRPELSYRYLVRLLRLSWTGFKTILSVLIPGRATR